MSTNFANLTNKCGVCKELFIQYKKPVALFCTLVGFLLLYWSLPGAARVVIHSISLRNFADNLPKIGLVVGTLISGIGVLAGLQNKTVDQLITRLQNAEINEMAQSKKADEYHLQMIDIKSQLSQVTNEGMLKDMVIKELERELEMLRAKS